MNERPMHAYRGFTARFPAESLDHLPQRPEWECRVCGADWPCFPARECLKRQHASDPTAIAMLMWTRLEEYAFDQGPGPLPPVFDRFIAWTRSEG